MKPFGIFLSGCGYKDGTDIWEAVLLHYFLEEKKIKTVSLYSRPYNPELFGKDERPFSIAQRNIFSDPGLLARGNLAELKEIGTDSLDALFLLGGEGILKRFTQADDKNPILKIDPELKRFIREIFRRKKPIASCGVASLLVACCLKDLTDSALNLTLGKDPELCSRLEMMGANHIITRAQEAVIDSENRIVSTPGAQLKTSLLDLGIGLKNLINGVLELTK